MIYYFDNSATTQPSKEALEISKELSYKYFANPSSAHKLGVEAHHLMNSARTQIADILKYQPEEIYFMSSGTEVNNFVFQGALPQIAKRREGRRVLISSIEHPATMRQIDALVAQGYQVELIPVNIDGRIDLEQLHALVDDEVVLVSTMAVNNEVGAVQPLEEIADILGEYPQAIWHVDGVQAVTTRLAILQHPRIDLMTLSSHKFHGIRGAGILAKRQRVSYQPLLYGGGQEGNLRSSTENLPANVVAARALRIAWEQQEETQEKLKNYRDRLIETFVNHGWQFFAEESASEHILCIALPSIPGEVLLHAFEEVDIYLSTTSACSSRTHQEHATLHAMGVPRQVSQSAIRVSMSSTTTESEVDYFISQIPSVTDGFKSKK